MYHGFSLDTSDFLQNIHFQLNFFFRETDFNRLISSKFSKVINVTFLPFYPSLNKLLTILIYSVWNLRIQTSHIMKS